ncbi:hypothetical protein Vafri_17892 [Volvox africanus]|uniref:PARP n=1 Tax=Volvox africanus TaxID=51714 RepID=A0A8J4BR95_9CHLO|nr:hypothetical protein Vafri_17892 [Volvox africanus]
MSSNSLQELLAEVKAYPDGTDLLITALYTAVDHFRRGSICTPFPSEVFPPVTTTGNKDFPALKRALDALPPVHVLLSDEALAKLPPQALELLKWLLLNPARQRRFARMSLEDLIRQLRERGGDLAWLHQALTGQKAPSYILQAMNTNAQAPFARSVIAYHGTRMENLHSIIHTGLRSMSGTRLQRNGANFGSGIYLSTRYDTALCFCEPYATWRRSRFGTKQRALLVCEVDMEKCKHVEEAGSGDAQIPETYLLVSSSDGVRLLYVLLYCDARHPQRSLRITPCTVIIALYIVFLLGKALVETLKRPRYY